MIEWQNESSLFTLRVQGKQWYWVYKLDAVAAYGILTAPKNIGHNRWFITVPGESYCADSYYQALHLGSQLEYKQLYLKFLADEKLTKRNIEKITKLGIAVNFAKKKVVDYKTLEHLSDLAIGISAPKQVQPVKADAFYDFPAIDETMNTAANILNTENQKPLRFVKGILNQHNRDILKNTENLQKPIIFVVKFPQNNGSLMSKVEDGEPLWGFKQKKYKRLQKFALAAPVVYNWDVLAEVLETKDFKAYSTLKKNTITSTAAFSNKSLLDESFNYQRAIKYNRQRTELVPVNLARRLLRTKRTLVLPAHVNLTVITNSYDVVHSWFIPGLGIKLDCVPGRSTHHTFYIDNVGFYYGQCAEICGRYHHHMPIRLCALPFEQFLIWWQKKGLRRLYRLNNFNKTQAQLDVTQTGFRYRW